MQATFIDTEIYVDNVYVRTEYFKNGTRITVRVRSIHTYLLIYVCLFTFKSCITINIPHVHLINVRTPHAM